MHAEVGEVGESEVHEGGCVVEVRPEKLCVSEVHVGVGEVEESEVHEAGDRVEVRSWTCFDGSGRYVQELRGHKGVERRTRRREEAETLGRGRIEVSPVRSQSDGEGRGDYKVKFVRIDLRRERARCIPLETTARGEKGSET